jgi:2-amino-4-hydroxy-6-hydroxymethyldihydropteridine diphosphokinase
MEHAWIGLGSNLGDRERMLAGALGALARTPGIHVVAASRVYETDPVGPPPQGPYLNAAAELAVELPAAELLVVLHRIEQAAGRERQGVARWSARTLDLDLLLFGEQHIETRHLVVPHPRMHERAFVLVPLSEVARDVRHPVLGRSVGELLAALGEPEGIRRHTLQPLKEDPTWPLQP